MTAEVCVMNRTGIALAADSAVTLSSSGEKKIYPSVDKLFNLSKTEPVGIMVYGNASYLELMWETVVKEYRRQVGAQRFEFLKEHADNFLEFLENEEIFPESIQNRQVSKLIHMYFSHILGRIVERLRNEAEQSHGIDEETYSSIITDELREILSRVKARPRLEGFGRATISKIREEFRTLFRDARSHVFENLKLERSAVRHLNQIGVEYLTRDMFDPLESGVVIAGFGEKEFFPRLYSFRIEGRVLGKLRIVRDDPTELSDEHTASIIPFAQQEMVQTFMNGIDPGFHQFVQSTTHKSLIGAIEKIGNVIQGKFPEYNDEIEPVVNEATEQLLKSMFYQWQEKQQDYWGPVVDIVESLPKDELASMAEALVNLTKFRRRVTPELETVGGPIDVAVISKGDGFVWVKRKHYFNAALNPRIMARYQMEANHEQNQ